MNILFAAAENGALPGGKVGGIGDVIRDLPRALAGLGHEVTVITPGYGSFGKLPGARSQPAIEVAFAGDTLSLDVRAIDDGVSAVRHIALDHPLFYKHGRGRIYHDDPPDRPFAADASRFALFSAATATWASLNADHFDVLHLHDWHTGLVAALRRHDPAFAVLQERRVVFSIHNLAYQGTRPLAGDASSFTAWFPELDCDIADIVDPRYANCVNPMATAIRLADGVATVSPSYAQEILRPSDPAQGFVGGEGLESVLGEAAAEGRLLGILNGCEYADDEPVTVDWPALRATVEGAALESGKPLPASRPPALLTSVGRVTAQKMALFLERDGDGHSALERMLDRLAADDLFLMIGSGDPGLEAELREIANGRRNFHFLRGYSDAAADALYRGGDLFLMPSSFEPCGISQMLAMRAGQPCVVHGIGGLRDTVEDGVTGFVFTGATASAQADAFVAAVERALAVYRDAPRDWQAVKKAAAAKRFSWQAAAADYLGKLYGED